MAAGGIASAIMKILLAHNFYGSSAPSGENTVFTAEKKLLEDNGHVVIEYTRHSDEIRKQGGWGALKGAVSTLWNPFSRAGILRKIEQERPDILHVHNFFPLLSPAIFYTAGGMKTATVFTLHNYRIFCAAAIPMRAGAICTECLDRRSIVPALRNKCYRNSFLATLPLAVMIHLHRWLKTWQNHIDAFIALTEFQKGLLVQGGLPENNIFIKPHFYPDPPAPVPWKDRHAKVVYMGRLSEEKGVESLIEAWRQWGDEAPLLELIGDGPLRTELEQQAQTLGGKIRFAGQLPFAEAQDLLATARLLVLPSVCFEGFPMVLREAFALGVPVAVSNLGAMPCIVEDGENGVLFTPGEAQSLLQKVRSLWDDQETISRMAENARGEFEAKYTAAANYSRLMEIYESAIENRKSKISA